MHKEAKKFAEKILNTTPLSTDILADMLEAFVREQVTSQLQHEQEVMRVKAQMANLTPMAQSTVPKVQVASRRF